MLAIIGGTGLASMAGMSVGDSHALETPFGLPSAEPVSGVLNGQPVVFLARHGIPHRIPPHKLNYRANLWALRMLGVSRIIAVAAVGGIRRDMGPAQVVIPDQIIDYSHGRPSTFFEDDLEAVSHIDFSDPYSPALRAVLLAAAEAAGVKAVDGGTYGCTQGPRLETAAEIRRLERDGCDLVGMTGMPEACLARELEMDYACCAVVANWAAGKAAGPIAMAEIERNLVQGMTAVGALLEKAVVSF